MRMYLSLESYTALGLGTVVVRVREGNPGEALRETLRLASTWRDDGTTDPISFAQDALTAMLEELYDEAPCRGEQGAS